MPNPVPVDPARVRALILETLPKGGPRGGNPAIFGGANTMDSLALVNFLADLEYALAREFGREVVLASERAMSRSRSPFRDVDELTGYVSELLA